MICKPACFTTFHYFLLVNKIRTISYVKLNDEIFLISMPNFQALTLNMISFAKQVFFTFFCKSKKLWNFLLSSVCYSIYVIDRYHIY